MTTLLWAIMHITEPGLHRRTVEEKPKTADATCNSVRAIIGAGLSGGISVIQFRTQATGTAVAANFLCMLPYLFTTLVLVGVTWGEALRKQVEAPAALGLPYERTEKA